MTQERIDEKVQEVIKRFDFKKVHKVMLALNWEWVEGKRAQVPSIPKLKKHAEWILHHVCDNNIGAYTCMSGGFEAQLTGETLTLRFVIEYIDAYLGNDQIH